MIFTRQFSDRCDCLILVNNKYFVACKEAPFQVVSNVSGERMHERVTKSWGAVASLFYMPMISIRKSLLRWLLTLQLH